MVWYHTYMVIDTAPLTYQLELDSGVLTWGDALYTTYGYDRSEPANTVEWWAAHILADDAMQLNEAIDKLFEPKVLDWTTEYHFSGRDNRYVLVRDHAVIERDQSGHALRLHGTITRVD